MYFQHLLSSGRGIQKWSHPNFQNFVICDLEHWGFMWNMNKSDLNSVSSLTICSWADWHSRCRLASASSFRPATPSRFPRCASLSITCWRSVRINADCRAAVSLDASFAARSSPMSSSRDSSCRFSSRIWINRFKFAIQLDWLVLNRTISHHG